VFSSASNRGGLGFSGSRATDLFGEAFGIGERTLDEYLRPAEMARRLGRGLGFVVHDDDLPYSDTMAGQVRLTPGKGVAKRDSRELRLETLLDDVSCDEIAL